MIKQGEVTVQVDEQTNSLHYKLVKDPDCSTICQNLSSSEAKDCDAGILGIMTISQLNERYRLPSR